MKKEQRYREKEIRKTRKNNEQKNEKDSRQRTNSKE